MSKIAEKRVNELGYSKYPLNREEFTANDIFDCGVECYDQAMQDFLEKAEEYLRKEFVDMWLRYIRGHSMDEEIEMFKNYIQDESEK